MNANVVASNLGYDDIFIDGNRLTARQRGHLTLETVRKFMQGGLPTIEQRHVPRLGKLELLDQVTLDRLDSTTIEDANPGTRSAYSRICSEVAPSVTTISEKGVCWLSPCALRNRTRPCRR